MKKLGVMTALLVLLVVAIGVGVVEAINGPNFRALPLDDPQRSPGYTGPARFTESEEPLPKKGVVVAKAAEVTNEPCPCDKAAAEPEKKVNKAKKGVKKAGKKGFDVGMGLMLVAIVAIVAIVAAIAMVALARSRQTAAAAPAPQPQAPPAVPPAPVPPAPASAPAPAPVAPAP